MSVVVFVWVGEMKVGRRRNLVGSREMAVI